MILGVTNITLCMFVQRVTDMLQADCSSSQRIVSLFGWFHDPGEAYWCYGVQGFQHYHPRAGVSMQCFSPFHLLTFFGSQVYCSDLKVSTI